MPDNEPVGQKETRHDRKTKSIRRFFSLLLLLAGCALPGASAPPESLSGPSSMAEEGLDTTARAKEEPPWWSNTFKQREFSDFFFRHGYGYSYANYINFTVDGQAAVQDKENSRNVCALLSSYLYSLDEQNGTLMAYDPAIGQVVYPVARMERLAEEMFGFSYDFSHALTLSETAVDGYMTQLYADDSLWRTVVFVVDSSLDYANGEIRIQVDYWLTGENGNYPVPEETREFLFAYRPNSALCPYHLISVTAAGGLLTSANDLAVPKTADVTRPDTVLLRPPEAIVYATGGLNLREGPDAETPPVLLIPDSSWVQVLGCQAADTDFAWLYVDYNGEQGWVSRDYLYQHTY